eukprot:TRINITY_DN2839_c0_g1_i2.p1 TRINITY_DN2839_c0_g1~~TRINITY_DN2839_c0_g1_i2.p1  ORF type:complete len:406 (+),score=107.21 TRINITY_DN2839_c0_g1_i2:627-1844(+)
MSNTKLRIETLSPSLSEFQNRSRIEIPGQFTEEREPSLDHHVRIERFGSEIEVLRKPWFGSRCLKIRGNTGETFSFCIQHNPLKVNPDEDRLIQLFRLFNHFFDKHRETRKRNVSISVPIIVSLSPFIRLVQASPNHTSLAAIYEDFCTENNIDPDAPLMQFKKKSGSSRNSKLQMYNDTLKNIPDNVLSRFVFRNMSSSLNTPSPSFNNLFTFKKNFTTQYAVSSFIGYIMGIGNRSTQTVYFSQSTGDVLQIDFFPVFNYSGIIENKEQVAFRLTPNICTFMNPIGLDGVFNTVITTSALCLNEAKTQLPSYLHLLLRDELIAWCTQQETPLPAVQAKDIKDKTATNTTAILQKIQNVAPPLTPSDNKKAPAVPINKKVSDLILAATSPTNLCQMDPTWHPWF